MRCRISINLNTLLQTFVYATKVESLLYYKGERVSPTMFVNGAITRACQFMSPHIPIIDVAPVLTRQMPRVKTLLPLVNSIAESVVMNHRTLVASLLESNRQFSLGEGNNIVITSDGVRELSMLIESVFVAMQDFISGALQDELRRGDGNE